MEAPSRLLMPGSGQDYELAAKWDALRLDQKRRKAELEEVFEQERAALSGEIRRVCMHARFFPLNSNVHEACALVCANVPFVVFGHTSTYGCAPACIALGLPAFDVCEMLLDGRKVPLKNF